MGSGILARAVERGETCLATPGGIADPSFDLPFAPLAEGRCGVAVPVSVGGELALVVYADDSSADARASGGVRVAAVEVLARYAGRCLESQVAPSSSLAATLPVRRSRP